MKHLKYSLPAFLMTVIIIIIGCAKKEVLLTIGDEKYTVQDFKNRMSFAPTEDSLKRMQKVNDFINEMLVIHEARAQNYENEDRKSVV